MGAGKQASFLLAQYHMMNMLLVSSLAAMGVGNNLSRADGRCRRQAQMPPIFFSLSSPLSTLVPGFEDLDVC